MTGTLPDPFNLEESRKLAVLIARSWSDPQLAAQYRSSPDAVLSGAGIDLAGRPAPDLPEKPADLGSGTEAQAASSSASSLSTITCPCTGCTASCANCAAAAQFESQQAAMLELAKDPAGRQQARQLASSWGISVSARQ